MTKKMINVGVSSSDSKPKFQNFSFMVEVIKRNDCPNEFLVRVPMPNGSMALACVGDRTAFDDFISGL